MSVLVKNMEMPENCGECRMDTEIGFCSAMPDNFCGYTDDRKRPDWCPLVELKPHGALIDRDALKKDYRMGNDCNNCETDWKSCQYDIVYSKMDFCGWLDDASVVIEVEGEG